MRIERQKTEDRFRAPGPYIRSCMGLAPWTDLSILVFPFNFKSIYIIFFFKNAIQFLFNLRKLNGNRKGLKKSRWVDPIFCCEYRF